MVTNILTFTFPARLTLLHQCSLSLLGLNRSKESELSDMWEEWFG